jgi:hypothetical protein
MEPSPRGILVLHPSKRKVLLLLAICLSFTAVGVAMILEGEGLSGWFVTAFFGLGLAVSLATLWPGASYLKLTRKGMECRSLFRRWPFIPWETVGEFDVSKDGSWTMVVFNRFVPARPLLAAFNRGLVGKRDALPDTYGLKAEKLAELLNEWRRRALS